MKQHRHLPHPRLHHHRSLRRGEDPGDLSGLGDGEVHLGGRVLVVAGAVRELPHLTSLSQGKVPGLEGHVARRLARRALEAAQGHPKLLELADGQAAHPDRLATLVSVGEQAWRTRGGVPEGLFTDDRSDTSPTDFTDVLAKWAQDAAVTLSDTERDLFWFLTCLEERDRAPW